MAYKIINNILDSRYWVNLVDSPFLFKKVKFSDLFKEVREETSREQKDKVKNEIVINTVLNIESIDDILSGSDFQNLLISGWNITVRLLVLIHMKETPML